MQCASKGHKYKCIKEVLDLCLLVMQPNVFIFFPFEMHCDAHYLDCCLVAWLPASHRLFTCFVHIFFFFGRFHLIGKKNFLLIFRHTWTTVLKRNNTQSVRIVAWLWSSFCMCSMFNHLFGCVCGNRWRQNMKKIHQLHTTHTYQVQVHLHWSLNARKATEKNVCHSIRRPNGFKSTEQNEMFEKTWARNANQTRRHHTNATQTSRTNQVGLHVLHIEFSIIKMYKIEQQKRKNWLHSHIEMK